MRQMFWVGRYDPSVMKEAMLELKHHVYAKDKLEIVDRTKHEKFLQQTTIERDQLKQQVDRNRKGKFSSERVFSLFSVRKFEKNSNRTRKRNESINQFERKRNQTTQQKTGRIRRGTSKTCRTDANRRTKRFFRRSSRENFAIFFLRFASKRVGQKTFNRPKSISLGSIVRPTNRRRTSTAHSNQHWTQTTTRSSSLDSTSRTTTSFNGDQRTKTFSQTGSTIFFFVVRENKSFCTWTWLKTQNTVLRIDFRLKSDSTRPNDTTLHTTVWVNTRLQTLKLRK